MKKISPQHKRNSVSPDSKEVSLGSKFMKKKQEKMMQSVVSKDSEKNKLDSDGDGLTDFEEKIYHTDPKKADTDGDGYDDQTEIKEGTNPLDPKDHPGDKKSDTSPNKTNLFQKFMAFRKKLKLSIDAKEKESKDEREKNFSDKELVFNKKKKRKVSVSRYEHIRHLKDYLEKAGYTVTDESKISQKVNIFAAAVIFIFTAYLIYSGIVREDKTIFIISQVILSWVIILPSLIVAFWVIFYFVIDFKIYNRRKELEEVLPDFLQLTSANINAGMPLDQALWYAVRPRFGILAKEIEDVAKSTIVGEDLSDALMNFSKRYDSPMLKRTINLMLEGLDAGGEIGPLLNKISTDIQETRIIKKDMAANVTTYVIFISFATLMAAPFLFALSNQLLSIIQSLITNIKIPQEAASGGMLSLSFSSDAISMANFRIFAISTLTVTSFFSAVIISTIRYGNVKDGIKYIPIFIGVSVVIYLIATSILGYFLGGII